MEIINLPESDLSRLVSILNQRKEGIFETGDLLYATIMDEKIVIYRNPEDNTLDFYEESLHRNYETIANPGYLFYNYLHPEKYTLQDLTSYVKDLQDQLEETLHIKKIPYDILVKREEARSHIKELTAYVLDEPLLADTDKEDWTSYLNMMDNSILEMESRYPGTTGHLTPAVGEYTTGIIIIGYAFLQYTVGLVLDLNDGLITVVSDMRDLFESQEDFENMAIDILNFTLTRISKPKSKTEGYITYNT